MEKIWGGAFQNVNFSYFPYIILGFNILSQGTNSTVLQGESYKVTPHTILMSSSRRLVEAQPTFYES